MNEPLVRARRRTASRPLALKILLTGALGASVLTGCGDDDTVAETPQPVIGVRTKAVLTVDGKQFKDANGNGTLDVYEDWRRPVQERIDHLVSLMTLEEKAGLMLIDTMNAGAAGALPTNATNFVQTQQMRRFSAAS
jgi:beta-glucosidase